MDPFDDPDSAELLMMDIDIAELTKQSNWDSSHLKVSCADDFINHSGEIRTRSFLRCELSKEFAADGFILSAEFEKFLNNESPVTGIVVSF
jgi:hypothetical protein